MTTEADFTTVTVEGHLHVLPISDAIDHERTVDCPCGVETLTRGTLTVVLHTTVLPLAIRGDE